MMLSRVDHGWERGKSMSDVPSPFPCYVEPCVRAPEEWHRV
jgi:hypothetical protein